MHIHQLDTLYQSKGSKNSSWVIWGHRGQKCEFLQLKRLNKKTNRFNFFLSSSSSFFLTICFFFHMLDRILTKLGQNDQWVSGYKSYALFDLKGHVRVTGVKRSFLRKMHLLLHALLDFDETWSEASVGKWLQKLCFV